MGWPEWLVLGLGIGALLAWGELVATGVLDLGGLADVEDEGLAFASLEAWLVLLTEYGPAVAGLAASSGLLDLLGRMGATERPPRDPVASK